MDDPKFGTYSIRHHSNSIACRKCGKSGRVIWDSVSRNGKTDPELVGIEGPFYERLSNKPPYAIEMVCRDCDVIAISQMAQRVEFAQNLLERMADQTRKMEESVRDSRAAILDSHRVLKGT